MADSPKKVPHRNYTLADIANDVGISATAVSMALRNSGGVSEELRERVLKRAREMNYVPALAARVLRARHTGQLGLNLPLSGVDGMENSEGFFMPVIAHFVNHCEINRYSYHIELAGKGDEFTAPAQLTGRLVDGILMAGKHDHRLIEWLDMNPGYKWVSVMEPAEYCVLSGNASGIYRAMEYLAALGHRDIALAHCNVEFDVHAAALKGYRQACGDFGLNTGAHLCQEIRQISNRDFLLSVNEWCDYILSPERRPTAIMCNDIKFAHALMIKAAAKSVSIPGDLSIIAYGTKSGAERIYPFLTTVEADFAAIMEKSIVLLINRIKDNIIPDKCLSVEPKLVKRDSVMAPNVIK